MSDSHYKLAKLMQNKLIYLAEVCMKKDPKAVCKRGFAFNFSASCLPVPLFINVNSVQL